MSLPLRQRLHQTRGELRVGGIEHDTALGQKPIPGSVGRVKVRQVPGKRGVHRARAIRVARIERGMPLERAYAVECPATRIRRLYAEPLIDHELLARPSPVKVIEQART